MVSWKDNAPAGDASFLVPGASVIGLPGTPYEGIAETVAEYHAGRHEIRIGHATWFPAADWTLDLELEPAYAHALVVRIKHGNMTQGQINKVVAELKDGPSEVNRQDHAAGLKAVQPPR